MRVITVPEVHVPEKGTLVTEENGEDKGNENQV